MARIIIILGCIWLGLIFSPAALSNQDETVKQERAVTFVMGLTNQLFVLLENASLSEADKRAELDRLIHEKMNIDVLAGLLLARSHRRSASELQLADFDELSREYIVDLFIDRISQLGKRRLELIDASMSKSGDVIVRTRLRRKDGSPVDVDWRIREKDGIPGVINLSANGVSFIIVKRAEFSSIVKKEGFDALLRLLRDGVSVQTTVETKQTAGE